MNILLLLEQLVDDLKALGVETPRLIFLDYDAGMRLWTEIIVSGGLGRYHMGERPPGFEDASGSVHQIELRGMLVRWPGTLGDEEGPYR